MRDGGQALIQASTGIGKTMAALFPAIRAMGEGHTDRIFFLTARNTGKASARQGLAYSSKKGPSAKTDFPDRQRSDLLLPRRRLQSGYV
jgi:DNA excision repair protein ERCC-2